MSMLDRALAALESRLLARIRAVVARGELTAIGGGKMQAIQASLTAGEIKGDVEHFEPAGFTSHPLAGAEPLVLFPGGDRSHGIAVVVADRRTRPGDLPEGAACVYCPADGIARILLLPGGEVRIEGKVLRVAVTERFVHSTNGHGEEWLPDRVNSWTIGAAAGTPHPITPPEIP
ncbi:phage baseplate assembly protein [Magnetospirillum molischianum]|uniref:Bacteriophage Mu Gp45 N-terminal domain-containing protein n=1 Tax=Magnetospirillum molischianum DSM 120 TaxID=1150626 RepID=H8FV03_MAGML|nr:phage baseplate assembly protein [Magnetospirillum molischianum]CCG42191.1 hypothetical protein PHAMO_340064 [Magnetospirillum molischianum DSM 120]